MADAEPDPRSQVIAARAELTEALETMRSELLDVRRKVRTAIPIAAAGAVAIGFVAAGGIGATARLIKRL